MKGLYPSIWFVWWLLCLLRYNGAMKVFVTKYNYTKFVASETNYLGVTYKTDQFNKTAKIKELTWCFRINIEYFNLLRTYSYLLEMLDGGGWENGKQVKENQLRIFEFRIQDPVENSHLFRMKTFLDQIVKARGEGNRNWHWPKLTNPIHIQEWNHFCTGYSAISRRMLMMHNGIIEIDHTRPKMVEQLEDFLPSQWFGPMKDGTKGEDEFLTMKGLVAMKKDLLQGSFTDFNVWNSLLSVDEMKRFTLCQENMQGSLLPWRGDDWQMTEGIGAEEYNEVEMEFKKICSLTSKYLFLPEQLAFQESINVCRKFKGQMVITETEDDYQKLTIFLSNYGGVATWLRFTDVYSEGIWVDFHTRKEPPSPIPWLLISEPTGFNGEIIYLFCYTSPAENCSGFPHIKVRGTAFDVDCRQLYPTVCQVRPYAFF